LSGKATYDSVFTRYLSAFLMFTECYCTQFRRASNALTRVYDDALRPVGLRITQLSVLRALARLGQATSTQLAQELSLDRTTISRNVKLLIDANWIDVVEAEDKRERLMSLNRAGLKMIASATPFWLRAQETVEKSAHPYIAPGSRHGLLEALQSVQQADVS
jgi:DNA-binding MarR family transcriptional regulator